MKIFHYELQKIPFLNLYHNAYIAIFYIFNRFIKEVKYNFHYFHKSLKIKLFFHVKVKIVFKILHTSVYFS